MKILSFQHPRGADRGQAGRRSAGRVEVSPQDPDEGRDGEDHQQLLPLGRRRYRRRRPPAAAASHSAAGQGCEGHASPLRGRRGSGGAPRMAHPGAHLQRCGRPSRAGSGPLHHGAGRAGSSAGRRSGRLQATSEQHNEKVETNNTKIFECYRDFETDK
jgi:hypothetical protein